MKYRRAGSSGPPLPVVGLAFGQPSGATCDASSIGGIVAAAIDAGVTLFDTADVNCHRGGAEIALGRSLRGRRDSVVLCTKFGGDMGVGGPRGARRYINEAVEASLRRLGTDCIDIYQQHGPDDSMPFEETLSALHRLVKEGKIRYFGGVGYELWRLHEAAAIADTVRMERLSTVQYPYSLLDRRIESQVVTACGRGNVGVLATDPLAGGILGDGLKAERSDLLSPPVAARRDALEVFARERGICLTDVAIGGLLGQPTVAAVILPAHSVRDVQIAASAAGWAPQPGDFAAIDAIVPRASKLASSSH